MDAHGKQVAINAQANAAAWFQVAEVQSEAGETSLAKEAQRLAYYWNDLALGWVAGPIATESEMLGI